MKSIASKIGLATMLLIGFASCRQDQNCKCIVNGETTIITYEQETKSNAKDACADRESAAKLLDPVASCEIVD